MPRSSLFLSVASAAVLLSAIGGCRTHPDADLVVVNGTVWTGDQLSDGTAVAVTGNRIVLVGTDAEMDALIGQQTVRIDAEGGLVAPGFIDSHVHLLTGGLHLASVQLRDARSKEEFVSRIADFASRSAPGEWIIGGDWDHTGWGGQLPERAWIDAVTPDNPVWINRLDGHMALANSAALNIAGVTARSADVAGGEIVRRANGEPTGILKDNAMVLIDRAVPEFTVRQRTDALKAAMAFLLEQGVTSVHDMAGEPGSYEALRVLHDRDDMSVRVYEAFPLSQWRSLQSEIDNRGTGDDWLRIGGLKGFVDGSLGSHTAAFFEPFSDAPNDSGLFVTPPDSLKAWMIASDSLGLQNFVHAIGDRAIATILGIMEDVAAANGPRDRRFRVEHAQHIRPDDLPRFAADGVIASMQPYHAIDDGRWAEDVIGPDRIKSTYAFRSLIDGGAQLAFGSDWFVAPPTPIEGIYAAVTRRTLDGQNPAGWVPEQKISVEEALRAYTTGASFAGFSEKSVGSLQSGYLADIVILDRDILAEPVDSLGSARIRMTISNGKVVYDGAR